MTAFLPLTALFPSSPSPFRIAAAAKLEPAPAPAPTSAPAATAPAAAPTPAETAAATRTADIQGHDTGVMGLVHTSLTGLNNFLKNLPQRKTLLGE